MFALLSPFLCSVSYVQVYFFFKKLCFHFRLLSCAHINDRVTGNSPAGNFSVKTINLYKLYAFESFTG